MKLFLFLTFILSLSTQAKNFANRGGLIVDEAFYKSKKTWLSLGKSEKESILELVKIIESVPLGQKLMVRAREKALSDGKLLHEVVRAGDVSITDTTLIRRFSQSKPYEVEYDAKSVVVIDKAHDVKNAVLDLVHEITHYVFKKPFNPYQKTFSVHQFMKDTIEGKGGEVDAFVLECRIGSKIFGNKSVSSQCEMIIDENSTFSRKLAKAEFYKLGPFFTSFKDLARKYNLHLGSLHYVSKEASSLISSAWGVPYPMAVFEEYETIMGRVCENDKKRLQYFDSNISRMPASTQKSYREMERIVLSKCRNFF